MNFKDNTTKRLIIFLLIYAIILVSACNKSNNIIDVLNQEKLRKDLIETGYSEYSLVDNEKEKYCVCRDGSNYIIYIVDDDGNLSNKSSKFSVGMLSARIWIIPNSDYIVETEVMSGNNGWVEIYYKFDQVFNEEYRIYHYGLFNDDKSPVLSEDGTIITEEYLVINNYEAIMTDNEKAKYIIYSEEDSIDISRLEFQAINLNE